MSGDARTVRPGEVVTYHNAPAVVVKASTAILPELISAFRELTDEQRLEVMSACCKECGTVKLPCYCSPGYDE